MVAAVLSVLCAQLVALSWQPEGAGNSILNFGLAGAIVGASLREARSRRVMPPAILAMLCFLLLLAARDIHGVAAESGALSGAALLPSDGN